MMAAESNPVGEMSAPYRARRSVRWSRLCLKELRETLRDRRTLATLILMPLLVYPILSMVFQRSLISAWQAGDPEIVIGVPSKNYELLLKSTLAASDAYLKRTGRLPSDEQRDEMQPGLDALAASDTTRPPRLIWNVSNNLVRQVEEGKIDLGILPVTDGDSRQLKLIYRAGSALSRRSLEYVEERLRAANEWTLRKRLRQAGATDRLAFQLSKQKIVVESTDSTLATLVPMILILMTVTGAVYPAIDLTAGERERGTLEILMAAPVPRLKLLLAKYVAVVLVACLTALVNLLAMTITLQATGLSRAVFGEMGLSAIRIIQILGLLVLFAAFFSAVLLTLTSFARSFKEAQAYLIPLMLLSLGPAIVSLNPDLELSGLLAITPVSNMVLLARDLCSGGVNPLMAMVAILSTALYTLCALAIAARIFGTDAVLSTGQMEWADLLTGGHTAGGVPTVQGALMCLAAVFPIYFLVSNALGQLSDFPLSARLVATGVATSLLFGAVPWCAGRLQKLDLGATFQCHRASLWTFLAALVLGLSLWPLAQELVLWSAAFGLVSIRPEQIKMVAKLLDDFRDVSPFWILLSMAIAPAVFEELFFRGYLFSALRMATTRRTTILTSACLFGLFHVVSSSALSTERFLPSTFLGLVLGWICYRTGSILPGIVLHACHNGLLLMIAYYQDTLAAWGWGIQEQRHLPLPWIGTSMAVVCIGMWIIAKVSPWPTVDKEATATVPPTQSS